MKRLGLLRIPFVLLLLGLSQFGLASPTVQDPLKVVTTLPGLADIVREIGGDQVHVDAICKGTENVHSVRLKPSHVVMTSRCDAFFQVGLSLEHAWVPGLIQTSRNKKIQPGSAGLVTVSEGMGVLEKRDSLSRREGADLHPEGNPHVNLAREAGRHMAAKVRDALIVLRPEGKAKFEERFQIFESKCKAAEARWKKLAGALKGRKVITYHTEFTYLLHDLGLETIATIEPKPGVPPTPGHLAEVVKTALANPGVIVLTAAWSNTKAVDRVVEAGKCQRLVLASMASTDQSWLDHMEALHQALAQGFGVTYPVESDGQTANDGTQESDPGNKP
ncbi:MAG: metal ABC transporter substrate-binding protein [Planctomycetes bacterium]|nr:metal ABC transporter substrate-binding protein [Planctomycetota bacterium]